MVAALDPQSSIPMKPPRDLLILSISFFFIFMGAGAVQQHLTSVPVVQAHSTYVLAILYTAMMIGRVFVAYSIVKLGGFLSEILGAVTYFLFALGLGLLNRVEWVYLLAVIWGLGGSSMWITSGCHILEASQRRHYGTASGFFYMMSLTGQTLGVFLLQVVVTWAAVHGKSPRIMPLVAAGITLIGIAVMFGVEKGVSFKEEFRFSSFYRILVDERMFLVGIVQLLAAMCFGILLGVFQDYSKAKLGNQYPAVAFFAIKALMSVMGGRLSDFLGRDRILRYGFLLSTAGMLIAGMWTSRPMLSLSLCALALGTQAALVPTASTALVGDLVAGERRHLGLGAIFVWRDVGVVVALLFGKALAGLLGGQPLAIGPISLQGQQVVFLVFALVFAFCALITAWLTKKLTACRGTSL